MGFPWPSIESINSKTSLNLIKVEFMGAIVQWWVWIIKDSIFPWGLNQKKSPGFPKLVLVFTYFFRKKSFRPVLQSDSLYPGEMVGVVGHHYQIMSY